VSDAYRSDRLDPIRTYLGGDPVESPRRLRKHRLVREVRRIVEHAALLDLTELDESQLDALIERTRALADELEPLPSLRRHGGLSSSPDEDAALRERSGFSGRANPLAPPLHLWIEGDGVTRGRATWTAAYEGPTGCLHGGYVAAAFDDLMGIAQMASGTAGLTGTLTVKMIRPTPLYRPIDYAAGFDRVEGRKIWCWATARDGDDLLAEATIVFISPRRGRPG
jgi:acyl-coenzyme A thioesterase PaaI-like protein